MFPEKPPTQIGRSGLLNMKLVPAVNNDKDSSIRTNLVCGAVFALLYLAILEHARTSPTAIMAIKV